MSSDDQSDKECPLCMEPFEEVNFYPCSCQYQICPFCWHRLRTDENGLCPACRQPYPEKPVNFQPLSSAEIRSKQKNEKKQRNRDKAGGKLGISDNSNGTRKIDRQHLSVFRVLQRNLVYVIGLSQRLADAELLKKQEYFGKFGRIVKIAVGAIQTPNNATSNGNSNNASFTAYVTYGKMDEALKAIQTVNNLVIDGRLLKASLGTTKYCSNFLKGQNCHKQECMYLHEIADDELSFTKEDMHQGKHTEYERKLHEHMLNLPQQTQKRQDNNNHKNHHNAKQTQDVTAAASTATAAVDAAPPPPRPPSSTASVRSSTPPASTASSVTTTAAAATTGTDTMTMTTTTTAMSGAMTCCELEQMLINNSVPPGFHNVPPGFQDIPPEFRDTVQSYRDVPSDCRAAVPLSSEFNNQDFREAPADYRDDSPDFHDAPPGFCLQESSRGPAVLPSAANFFVDLYDDLGSLTFGHL